MISIIVPIYNAEQFLRECIDSILSQNYSNIEIILVNDGSRDGSLNICQSYDDSRIVLIDKENAGVSSARNAGLKVAKGEYIAFIDADDTLPVNALSLLLESLERYQVDLVVGSFMFQYGNVCRSHSARLVSGVYSFESLLSDFIDDGTLSGFILGSVCGVLYKKSIIELHRLFFNSDVKNNEDGLFNFEYALKAENVLILDECVYYYRQYNTSISASRQLSYDFNELIKKYLEEVVCDKDKYNFEIQFERRNVSLALWDILKYPCQMDLRTGVKFINQRLKEKEVREGFYLINLSQLSMHKKLFFYMMKWRCSFILYVFVKFVLPLIDSKISR